MIANQTARKSRPAATDAKPTKKRRWVNLEALAWAEVQDIPHSLVSTLNAIATHANAADWECWAALDTLAAMTRHNERTVRRKIAALESLGVVSTRLRYDDRGYRTTSAIKLNRPEPVVEADETRVPPTGHFSTAYRTPLPGPNEYLEERKNRPGGGSEEARAEPNSRPQSQPKERQAGRVESDERPCHKSAPMPPKEVIDAKAAEFINTVYPGHHAFTDTDRAEGASAFRQAVMRGTDPDLIIWAAYYFRAKMQRDQGRRPELPLWWVRKQRWNEQPGIDQFIASASDPKERKRVMAVAQAQSWMR